VIAQRVERRIEVSQDGLEAPEEPSPGLAEAPMLRDGRETPEAPSEAFFE
jgi:hypothetical protein